MSKKKDFYVPSLPEYEENEYEWDKILEDREKVRAQARKMPTSVTLPPDVVEELKAIAAKKGIPYQVLMRSFIMEGLERLKKSS
jgi:predicted DNA binding CopG/RHH family protein